jgi:hypothetical protein
LRRVTIQRRILRFPPALLLVAVAATALPCARDSSAAAQDTTGTRRDGWLIAGSVGVPGYESEPIPELMTVGVQWTWLHPGRVGPDFSLGTIPRALMEGVVAVGLRGGVALPIEFSPGMFLLPSAGLSLLGGFGEGGAAGLAGLNTGIAAVILSRNSVGVRTGVTWHRFQDSEGSIWLVEFGIVRGPGRSGPRS